MKDKYYKMVDAFCTYQYKELTEALAHLLRTVAKMAVMAYIEKENKK